MVALNSASQHSFAQIPSVSRPRSAFDRSHSYKTTFDAGYLVPFYVDEALPGDTFNVRLTAFARMATPIKPVMDNLFLTTFFFAVPLRLIWSNFVKMMGEQLNPGDSTDYVTPKITSPAGGYGVGTIFDYFGIPATIPGIVTHNFFGRAYNLIWNEWFRDENLQTRAVQDLGDGPDTPANYVLLRRGKRHDYFTSALPFPQKGPAVGLPLSGNARVLGLGVGPGVAAAGPLANVWETNATAATTYASEWNAASAAPIVLKAQSNAVAGVGNTPQVFADLSSATAATINQLRTAITLQQMYERDARGGTRYTEVVLSHFGVRSPDARLQRPEYLGGGMSNINISPIAQMSATAAGQTPQANLSGIGTTTVRGNGFAKSFTEHSVIIGLMCVHADLHYQQGVSRMLKRSTRFDFYWPTLANLGEQVITNDEIYATGSGNPTQDAAAFGYQERWAEYRYKPSLITGKFNSTVPTPLDIWHLAQNFTALPVLNAAFIQETPPINRVIAVTTEPHFLFDSYIQMRTVRPMPVYSVPGLLRL